METSLNKRHRFYELDLIRFICAFSVMMYHYTFSVSRDYGWVSFGVDSVSRYGFLGVNAFFMISGYVVLMSSMHKTPREFFISRVVRLYPTYWLICIICFCIIYFGAISMPGVPYASLGALAYNLTMLQNFFGKESLNIVFWTLTFEISFYFIILLISALKLWHNLLLILLIWLLYSVIAGPRSMNNAFAFLLIPKFSYCFIAGMLFYLLRIGYASKWKIGLLLLACYLLNIKSSVAILFDLNIIYHNAFTVQVLLIIITAFYIFFLLSALKKIDLSRFTFLPRLGLLTYPLYLIHPIGAGAIMLFAGSINKYLLVVIVSIVMLWLARLTYRFIEKPLQPFLKKKLNALLDYLS